MDRTNFETGLTRACEKHLGAGARVENLAVLTAGASAETWKFDLVQGSDRLPLILQRAAGGEMFGFALDRTVQGQLQQRMYDAGVITPMVRFVLDQDDQLGEGFVVDCVTGETLGQRIVRQDAFAEARKLMPAQCGEILAGIHGADLDGLPSLPNQSTAEMIAWLADTHRGYGESLPAFELAIQWLNEHIPPVDTPALVHGDFRTGNLMVNEQGIVAVLDWELAHIGDPMEDFGMLCTNSWRFGQIDKPVGGFGQRDEFYRSYESAGGRAVDPEAVRFWEVYCSLKWGVICQYFAYQHLSGSRRSMEWAAIGRRVSEAELDMLVLIDA